MARRKQSAQSATQPAEQTAGTSEPLAEGQLVFGDSLSLHDLFQQQAMAMLDRSDLSEEAKQEILVAMACPCCGAGAMSYTVKLKR
jgi:DNA-nicking Smr family endonuclease